MKKLISIALCTALLTSLAACSGNPKPAGGEDVTLTGRAKGFGGEVTVTVTKQGDKITAVEAVGEKETEGIGSKAIEQLPQAIVDANSTDVDVIAGASVTSKAIIDAVNNALDPEKYPAPAEEAEVDEAPAAIVAADVYQGFGVTTVPRVGPGEDDTKTPVYSFSEAFANVLFDGDGKILALDVDVQEVATPNYDGDGMPHFSGFPGQGGYNNDANHDAKVDGKTPDTVENFEAEVNAWVTKRERGDKYVMGTGTWAKQMDTYEKLFVGKTVEEVEEWFNKYTSDVNGRPLKDGSDKAEDKAKYDALSDDEKAMLVDVTTGATMSLKDPHGDIIGAIKEAYENRVGLDIKSASALGTALVSVPRVGPGEDDTKTSVYSFSQAFANTVFDEDGKILAINVDVLEVATPNYDGDGMPHFSGFPGQGGYNNDANHDAKVDGKTPDTVENFEAEVNAWVTKRDRGDKYVMGTGTWAKQMDTYQKLFVGKTVEEVEEWFNKYTSDVNGRPLKDGSDKPEDKAKYDALSDDEKTMLADVTTGATMSLKDPHGDIIAAIKKSFENRVNIDLTIK